MTCQRQWSSSLDGLSHPAKKLDYSFGVSDTSPNMAQPTQMVCLSQGAGQFFSKMSRRNSC